MLCTRKYCRQAEAKMVSNSNKKIHQTWPIPFSRALYMFLLCMLSHIITTLRRKVFFTPSLRSFSSWKRSVLTFLAFPPLPSCDQRPVTNTLTPWLFTGISSQIRTKLCDWAVGRQGLAATLRQQCPQMTRRRCTSIQRNFLLLRVVFVSLIAAFSVCLYRSHKWCGYSSIEGHYSNHLR